MISKKNQFMSCKQLQLHVQLQIYKSLQLQIPEFFKILASFKRVAINGRLENYCFLVSSDSSHGAMEKLMFGNRCEIKFKKRLSINRLAVPIGVPQSAT